MIPHRPPAWLQGIVAGAAFAGLCLVAPPTQAGDPATSPVARNHYLRATGQPVGPIDRAIYGSPYRGVGVPGHHCPCPVGPRCAYPYYTLRRPLDFMYRCGDGYGGPMDW